MGGISPGIPVTATAFPPAAIADRIVAVGSGTGQGGSNVFLAGGNAGQWTTQSDIIAVGHNALSAGSQGTPLNDANSQGVIVIGSGALAAATNFSTTYPGGAIVIGWQAGALLAFSAGNTIIGSQALANAVGTAGTGNVGNVIIGTQAGQNSAPTSGGNSYQGNVVIGYQAGQVGAVSNIGLLNSVVIGLQAMQNLAGVQPVNNVAIGYRAARNYGSGTNSAGVIIGSGAAVTLTSGQFNVLIGTTTDCGGTSSSNVIIGDSSKNSGAGTQDTLIGANIIAGTGGNNTIVGRNAGGSGNYARCIAIGSFAGFGFPAGALDFVAIETDPVTLRSALYGDMANGNMIICNSSVANQRNIIHAPNGATNILQIPNGTKSVTNPTSSGYFYVSAGALHWVGSAGTDTTLAPA